ncbi:MAG: phosphatase PAP2 family protein [Candidatus Roizmanbacteria bacterium]
MLTHTPLFLFFSNIILILGYAPINQLVKGGSAPKRKIDDIVPFVPAFVYPYVFAYFPWIILVTASVFFRPIIESQRLTLTVLIASIVGYGFFILKPTYVRCMYPAGKGITFKLLQLVYRNDKENNACPSMHVYMTIILMTFSWSANIYADMLIATIGIFIIASTVLTKRHYVLDIVGGMIVGTVSVVLATYILS